METYYSYQKSTDSPKIPVHLNEDLAKKSGEDAILKVAQGAIKDLSVKNKVTDILIQKLEDNTAIVKINNNLVVVDITNEEIQEGGKLEKISVSLLDDFLEDPAVAKNTPLGKQKAAIVSSFAKIWSKIERAWILVTKQEKKHLEKDFRVLKQVVGAYPPDGSVPMSKVLDVNLQLLKKSKDANTPENKALINELRQGRNLAKKLEALREPRALMSSYRKERLLEKLEHQVQDLKEGERVLLPAGYFSIDSADKQEATPGSQEGLFEFETSFHELLFEFEKGKGDAYTVRMIAVDESLEEIMGGRAAEGVYKQSVIVEYKESNKTDLLKSVLPQLIDTQTPASSARLMILNKALSRFTDTKIPTSITGGKETLKKALAQLGQPTLPTEETVKRGKGDSASKPVMALMKERLGAEDAKKFQVSRDINLLKEWFEKTESWMDDPVYRKQAVGVANRVMYEAVKHKETLFKGQEEAEIGKLLGEIESMVDQVNNYKPKPPAEALIKAKGLGKIKGAASLPQVISPTPPTSAASKSIAPDAALPDITPFQAEKASEVMNAWIRTCKDLYEKGEYTQLEAVTMSMIDQLPSIQDEMWDKIPRDNSLPDRFFELTGFLVEASAKLKLSGLDPTPVLPPRLIAISTLQALSERVSGDFDKNWDKDWTFVNRDQLQDMVLDEYFVCLSVKEHQRLEDLFNWTRLGEDEKGNPTFKNHISASFNSEIVGLASRRLVIENKYFREYIKSQVHELGRLEKTIKPTSIDKEAISITALDKKIIPDLISFHSVDEIAVFTDMGEKGYLPAPVIAMRKMELLHSMMMGDFENISELGQLENNKKLIEDLHPISLITGGLKDEVWKRKKRENGLRKAGDWKFNFQTVTTGIISLTNLVVEPYGLKWVRLPEDIQFREAGKSIGAEVDNSVFHARILEGRKPYEESLEDYNFAPQQEIRGASHPIEGLTPEEVQDLQQMRPFLYVQSKKVFAHSFFYEKITDVARAAAYADHAVATFFKNPRFFERPDLQRLYEAQVFRPGALKEKIDKSPEYAVQLASKYRSEIEKCKGISHARYLYLVQSSFHLRQHIIANRTEDNAKQLDEALSLLPEDPIAELAALASAVPGNIQPMVHRTILSLYNDRLTLEPEKINEDDLSNILASHIYLTQTSIPKDERDPLANLNARHALTKAMPQLKEMIKKNPSILRSALVKIDPSFRTAEWDGTFPEYTTEVKGKAFILNVRDGILTSDGKSTGHVPYDVAVHRDVQHFFGGEESLFSEKRFALDRKTKTRQTILNPVNHPDIRIIVSEPLPNSKVFGEPATIAVQRKIHGSWHQYLHTPPPGKENPEDPPSALFPEAVRIAIGSHEAWIDIEHPATVQILERDGTEYATLKLEGEGAKTKVKSFIRKDGLTLADSTKAASQLHDLKALESEKHLLIWEKKGVPVEVEYPRLRSATGGAVSYRIEAGNRLASSALPDFELVGAGVPPITPLGSDLPPSLPEHFHEYHLLSGPNGEQRILLSPQQLVPLGKQEKWLRETGVDRHDDIYDEQPVYNFTVDPDTGRLQPKTKAASLYLAYLFAAHKDYAQALSYLNASFTRDVDEPEYQKLLTWIEEWPDTSANGNAFRLHVDLMLETARRSPAIAKPAAPREERQDQLLNILKRYEKYQIDGDKVSRHLWFNEQTSRQLELLLEESLLINEAKEFKYTDELRKPEKVILQPITDLPQITSTSHFFKKVAKNWPKRSPASDKIKISKYQGFHAAQKLLEDFGVLVEYIKTADVGNETFKDLTSAIQYASPKDLMGYEQTSQHYLQVLVQSRLNGKDLKTLPPLNTKDKTLRDNWRDEVYSLEKELPKQTIIPRHEPQLEKTDASNTTMAQKLAMKLKITKGEVDILQSRLIAKELEIAKKNINWLEKQPLQQLIPQERPDHMPEERLQTKRDKHVQEEVGHLQEKFQHEESAVKRLGNQHKRGVEEFTKLEGLTEIEPLKSEEVKQQEINNGSSLSDARIAREEKREKILTAVNRTKDLTAIDRAEKFLGRYPKMSIADLSGALASNQLERVNQLGHPNAIDLEPLKDMILDYLALTAEIQHREKVGNICEQCLAKNEATITDPDLVATFNSLTSAERKFEYKGEHSHPHATQALLIEANGGFYLRSDQLDTISMMAEDPNTVEQLIMGAGKTKVLAPIIGLGKTNGTNLVAIILPDALYQTNLRDLDKTSRDLLAQPVVPFEFNRNTEVTAASLLKLHNKLIETIKERGLIATTRSSLLAYSHTFQILNQQLQTADPEEAEIVLAKMQIMAETLQLLKERMQPIGDEIHKLLDVRVETNFALGAEEQINQKRALAGLKIFKTIIAHRNDTDDNPLKTLANAILSNTQASLLPKERGQMLDAAAEEFWTEDLGIDRKTFAEYIRGKKIALATDKNGIPKFMTDLKVNQPEKYKEIVALKRFLSGGLPLTLSEPGSVLYGRDPENPLKVIPYDASNSPNIGSEFDSSTQKVAYTIQYYLQFGITSSQLETVLSRFKERAMLEMQEELAEGRYMVFEETMAAKHFQTVVKKIGGEETRFDLRSYSKESFERLLNEVNKEPEVILSFVETSVLPEIRESKDQIVGTGQDLVNMVHDLGGFSGTLPDAAAFPETMGVNKQESVDGKTYALLIDMKPEIRTISVDPKDPAALVDALQLGKDNRVALVDSGAYLKGISNQSFAETINRKTPNIAATVYVNSRNEVVLQQKSDTLAKLLEQAPPVPPENRITIFDQAHTVGLDVPQAPKGKAVVTIGEQTTTTDLFQAVWRMRKLDRGQKVEFVLTDAVKKQVMGGEGEAPSLNDILSFCTKNQAVREAQDVYQVERQRIEDSLRYVLKRQIEELTRNPPDGVENKAAFLQGLGKHFSKYLIKTKEDDDDASAAIGYQESPLKVLNDLKDTVEANYNTIIQELRNDVPNVPPNSYDKIIKELEMERDKMKKRPIATEEHMPDQVDSQNRQKNAQSKVQTQQQQQQQQQMQIQAKKASSEDKVKPKYEFLKGKNLASVMESPVDDVKNGMIVGIDCYRLHDYLNEFDEGIFFSGNLDNKIRKLDPSDRETTLEGLFHADRLPIKQVVIVKTESRWTATPLIVHDAERAGRELVQYYVKEPNQAVLVDVSLPDHPLVFESNIPGKLQPFTSEEDRAIYLRIVAQTRFLDGQVHYFGDQRKQMKQWIEEQGVEKMRDLFENHILPSASESSRTAYAGSSLQKLFLAK